ncbi:MAG: glutamate--tRNA ligase [Endomicrobium sp.]|jgi:glutamyl-tRNA synthetase|nr:glutamate--tRNA ligase [Endomicrobium sp.]
MIDVRVRFAPSPTGDLHIGGVRTALFNWLFAKNRKGKFILRIDDTDKVRSTEASVKAIFDAMRWLKLDWDEGPYNENLKYSPYCQMERKEKGIYQKYADELIAGKFAYYCYCTLEEVDAMRREAHVNKAPPKYDGRCRCLTYEQIEQKKKEGKIPVIRFKMPDSGVIVLNDIVRGKVKFDNFLLDDFVIIKANGMPTYNFACVVDDHLMEITHVLRGDDHISNTPKQMHIYNALNWRLPEFAHLAMILGSDGSRLSKRHGHMSVLEYRKEGFLQEALINYLALLGWSTEDSQQIFTIEDMKQKFSIGRCGTSPSIFDSAKLLWLNGEKIRSKTPEQIYELFVDWLNYTNNDRLIDNWDVKLLKSAIFLERNKIKLLKDILSLVDFFFTKDVDYREVAVQTVFLSEKSKNVAKFVLTESLIRLSNYRDFSATSLEKYARDLAVEKNIKTSQVFHPIRVAISGRKQGPSLFHMMEIMGREEVVRRINIAINKFFT